MLAAVYLIYVGMGSVNVGVLLKDPSGAEARRYRPPPIPEARRSKVVRGFNVPFVIALSSMVIYALLAAAAVQLFTWFDD